MTPRRTSLLLCFNVAVLVHRIGDQGSQEPVLPVSEPQNPMTGAL